MAVEDSIAQEQPSKVAQENGKVFLSEPTAVEKSSSYREESDFLSDLNDFEKKALFELKSQLEEAILETAC